MAAGLGTRLRPLTHEIPKPLVPVANRPIMEHILELLAGQDMREVVANLHWFGDTVRDRFGDGSELGIELTYSEEEKLLGTAGGVRNVRSFFGDDPFTVLAADALTDIDLQALTRTHERNDWIATLAVKRVTDDQRVRGRRHGLRRARAGIPGEAGAGRGSVRPRQLHDLRARPRGLRPLPGQGRARLRA